MSKKYTQEEISQRLNRNGWSWYLISTLTPGVVRIQMGSDSDEEEGWQKCVEAPSLEQAILLAEELVNRISATEYAKREA